MLAGRCCRVNGIAQETLLEILNASKEIPRYLRRIPEREVL